MQITWNYTIKPCVLFNVHLLMEKHWCVCVCIFLYRTVILCVFRVQCSDRHTGGDRQQFLQWFIQSVWMCLLLLLLIIIQCVCNSSANLCEVKRVNHSNQGLPITREIQTCPFITDTKEQDPYKFWRKRVDSWAEAVTLLNTRDL